MPSRDSRGPRLTVDGERARMTNTSIGSSSMTIGQAATRIGYSAWQIRSAIKLGYLDEPPPLGPFRTFQEHDLPRIVTALEAAGYSPGVGSRRKRTARKGVLVGSTRPGWAAETEDQQTGTTCPVCGGRELGPDTCLACLRGATV